MPQSSLPVAIHSGHNPKSMNTFIDLDIKMNKGMKNYDCDKGVTSTSTKPLTFGFE